MNFWLTWEKRWIDLEPANPDRRVERRHGPHLLAVVVRAVSLVTLPIRVEEKKPFLCTLVRFERSFVRALTGDFSLTDGQAKEKQKTNVQLHGRFLFWFENLESKCVLSHQVFLREWKTNPSFSLIYSFGFKWLQTSSAIQALSAGSCYSFKRE